MHHDRMFKILMGPIERFIKSTNINAWLDTSPRREMWLNFTPRCFVSLMRTKKPSCTFGDLDDVTLGSPATLNQSRPNSDE